MRRYSKDEEKDEKFLNNKRNASDSEDEKSKNSQESKSSSEKKESKQDAGEKKSIFIKNLAFSTKEDALRTFFEKFGTVTRANIIMRDGRSKGMGFIDFESTSDAQKVFESDHLELDGRSLTIDWANEKRSSNSDEKTKTIFVGNLSFKATDQSIEEFFSDCGKIESVRIAKMPDGKSKGFCHIDFSSEEDAENALKKNGEEFDGRSLRVDKTLPRNGNDRRGGSSRGGSFRGGRGRGRGGFRGDRDSYRDRDNRDRDHRDHRDRDHRDHRDRDRRDHRDRH